MSNLRALFAISLLFVLIPFLVIGFRFASYALTDPNNAISTFAGPGGGANGGAGGTIVQDDPFKRSAFDLITHSRENLSDIVYDTADLFATPERLGAFFVRHLYDYQHNGNSTLKKAIDTTTDIFMNFIDSLSMEWFKFD